MRHEQDRRKASNENREAYRRKLAGMYEPELLEEEKKLVSAFDRCNELNCYDESEIVLEKLSDLDDRLLYLERISFTNITNQLEQ